VRDCAGSLNSRERKRAGNVTVVAVPGETCLKKTQRLLREEGPREIRKNAPSFELSTAPLDI